jgi:hypothetical protein
VFTGRLGPPLLAALADELQQHHEQVDEVEIERQRTINAFVVSTSRGLVSR